MRQITRKQFLKAFAAAPALSLIGKGGSFYEIDYENGTTVTRWIDNGGREVWLNPVSIGSRFFSPSPDWVVIINGEMAFIYRETESAWIHENTLPKEIFYRMNGIWE